MIIMLVKQNEGFSRGLKSTTAETLNHQHVPEKDFKIIGNEVLVKVIEVLLIRGITKLYQL